MDTIQLVLVIASPVISAALAIGGAAWAVARAKTQFENRLTILERDSVDRISCIQKNADLKAMTVCLLDDKLKDIYSQLGEINKLMRDMLAQLDERLRAIENEVAEWRGAHRA